MQSKLRILADSGTSSSSILRPEPNIYRESPALTEFVIYLIKPGRLLEEWPGRSVARSSFNNPTAVENFIRLTKHKKFQSRPGMVGMTVSVHVGEIR